MDYFISFLENALTRASDKLFILKLNHLHSFVEKLALSRSSCLFELLDE
jgi:hypothetical protein